MPDKKKRHAKKPVEPTTSARIRTPVAHEFFSKGDEPWRDLKVKPVLELMRADPPESGIGPRIAFCRGQLDNLTIEALARYTRRFDSEGISRQSIVRYEAKETYPGAREIRIFCDALWVPVNWLILGIEEGRSEADVKLRSALRDLLIEMRVINLPLGISDLEAQSEKDKIAQRQRWLYDARQPQPRS